NPKLFGYVLGFSAAVGGQFSSVDETVKALPSGADGIQAPFRLVWVSCGRQDFLFNNNQQFVEMLRARGVKVTYRETDGAHVWSVWRRNLYETLSLLFQ